MKKNSKKPHFTDPEFKPYCSALQWVLTDAKVDEMKIKRNIHEMMKFIKKDNNWSSEQLFNLLMTQFVLSNKHIYHNKDRHKHVTIMLWHAERSLLSMLKQKKKQNY